MNTCCSAPTPTQRQVPLSRVTRLRAAPGRTPAVHTPLPPGKSMLSQPLPTPRSTPKGRVTSLHPRATIPSAWLVDQVEEPSWSQTDLLPEDPMPPKYQQTCQLTAKPTATPELHGDFDRPRERLRRKIHCVGATENRQLFPWPVCPQPLTDRQRGA